MCARLPHRSPFGRHPPLPGSAPCSLAKTMSHRACGRTIRPSSGRLFRPVGPGDARGEAAGVLGGRVAVPGSVHAEGPVGSRFGSSSGNTATGKAAPGRCFSALGISTHAAGTRTASLSSTRHASCGQGVTERDGIVTACMNTQLWHVRRLPPLPWQSLGSVPPSTRFTPQPAFAGQPLGSAENQLAGSET